MATASLWLPLSWKFQSSGDLAVSPVTLPRAKASWLTIGNVPEPQMASLPTLLHQQFGHQSFVLRGCAAELTQALLRHGGELLPVGHEALLDLHQPHLQKRSLQHMIQRGQRQGQVMEWPTEGHPVFEAWLQAIQTRYPAPLHHLFRTHLEEGLRLFTLQSFDNQPLALMTLTRNAPDAWQTELMVRHPQAPAGVMEALIAGIFEQLQLERARYWSLGEVPFTVSSEHMTLKANMLQYVGKRMGFVYQSQGLFHFKNKFQPQWRPLYLYGYPRISWGMLLDLFVASNCHRLVWNGLKQHVRATHWPMAIAASLAGLPTIIPD